MCVIPANSHMQEVKKTREKLREAKNEEERKVISQELEIAETKRQLADSRAVRQRNLMW